jgi:hypothetical protein
MTRGGAGLLLLALWTGAAPLPTAASSAPIREELVGGLELIVVPMPAASSVSLRYVVRAGSAHDPPGREGLAHLLEHLLAQGQDLRLLPDARARGAELNAFTSRDTTIYVLDAPRAAFRDLAERLLRSITDPRLDPAEIAREQAVVSREDVYGREGPGVMTLMEEAIFPAEEAESGPLGSSATRALIAREDLVRFFAEAYSTRNTTVILAGAIDAAQARDLVERNVLVPPALREEVLPPYRSAPTLPATSKVRAGFLAAALGYPLRLEDRGACQPLADLLELRLLIALQLREPLIRHASVQCELLRGNPFILAVAHGPSIEATDLPERIERILMGAAGRPPDGGERRLLERRLANRAAREALDPVARASSLAREAALPRLGGVPGVAATDPNTMSVGAMQAAARYAFRPGRRALLFLSPFEGRVWEAEDAEGREGGTE